MRVLAFLVKTFLENLREWKVLLLTLSFAPSFVYLMFGYFSAAAPAYHLVVVNHDPPSGEPDGITSEVGGLISAWREAKHPDGKPMFEVVEGRAGERIERRDADLLVEIPEGFSRSLNDFRERRGGPPAQLIDHADQRSARGSMAMALSDYVAYTYAAERTRAAIPLDVAVRSLGAGAPRSEFELFVPALLGLAIIMVLFTAASSLVKEVDQGTMTRLMLSRLRTSELLTAISLNQVLIGAAALALTYLAAYSCGYRSQGAMGALLTVGAVTTLSVVAIAVLTAAFLSSMFELLTVGTFPFFILMFFSECMFPLPRIELLHLGGHTLYANDVLPTSLGVKAFGRVLNEGAGLSGIAFELAAILLLTAIYFAIGSWLFQRRHQRI